jgi:ATP-binding cassette subfamily B protein
MEKNYKSFWQVLVFVFSYFKYIKIASLRWMTILSSFFFILTIFLNSITPLLSKYLIDLMNLSLEPTSKNLLLFYLFGYGFVWTFGQVTSQLREYFIIPVFCRLLRMISLDFVKHLLALSMKFHTFKQTGSVVAALNQAQSAIPDILFGSTFNVFPVFVEIIMVSGIIIYNYGFLYGCILLFLYVFYVFFILYSSKIILDAQRLFNAAKQKEFGKSTDTLINIETVKYFGTIDFELEEYDRLLTTRESAEISFFKTMELMHLFQGLIIGLGFSATVIFSGFGVLSGNLLISDFVMINSSLTLFVKPFMSIGKHIREIRKGVANMQNALQIIDIKPEVVEEDSSLEINDSSIEIKFNNVGFGYFSEIKILKELSFLIPEKKMTAIVGSTGSGKSTITKLLFRFYDVTDGQILLNGHNLKEYSFKSISSSFGIVPQSVAMFNDTLHYNLTYAKPDASNEEIWAALKIAQLETFVKNLPHGFETRVGEHGMSLSGGERQRLAIARAVLKKPKLFIFDEATSALDTNTERTIQQSLQQISKDITTLVIAHRLSTIINADQIIVLEFGSIVEIGTHQELLLKNGVYHKLWNEQFS